MPAVITTATAPFALALLTMSASGAGEPYGVYWPSPRHFVWGEVSSHRELLDGGRIQTEILIFRPDESAMFDGVPARTIRYQVILDCMSRDVIAASQEFYDDDAALLFRARFLKSIGRPFLHFPEQQIYYATRRGACFFRRKDRSFPLHRLRILWRHP